MSRPTSLLASRIRRWRRYRTTVRELENLTARELGDLGIQRADIRRIARQTAAM